MSPSKIKLKTSKFINPSYGLTDDGHGLVHFTAEGYNLLTELLEKASQKNQNVRSEL